MSPTATYESEVSIIKNYSFMCDFYHCCPVLELTMKVSGKTSIQLAKDQEERALVDNSRASHSHLTESSCWSS